VVFAAALAPDKPVLEDFVSGVPVNEAIAWTAARSRWRWRCRV
jgi:hypothetical protein